MEPQPFLLGSPKIRCKKSLISFIYRLTPKFISNKENKNESPLSWTFDQHYHTNTHLGSNIDICIYLHPRISIVIYVYTHTYTYAYNTHIQCMLTRSRVYVWHTHVYTYAFSYTHICTHIYLTLYTIIPKVHSVIDLLLSSLKSRNHSYGGNFIGKWVYWIKCQHFGVNSGPILYCVLFFFIAG